MLSGIAITAIYILSSASVLVAVPASELAERSGIADAVELVGGRLGLAGMGAFIGLLLVVGSIGGTSSWVAGAARVPFAAGVDAAMPAAFAKLHPKYRTPHVALIVQAIATTLLFLASVFVSVGGGETTIQEAYDIMVNLTILVYFLPYLYLFAAFIRLRSMDAAMPADENTIVLPGGSFGVWAIAGCGLLATLIAMGLVFVPADRDGEHAQLRGQSDRSGGDSDRHWDGVVLHRKTPGGVNRSRRRATNAEGRSSSAGVRTQGAGGESMATSRTGYQKRLAGCGSY